MIGSLHSRHRAIEFKKFLQTLEREVPAELDVHLVLDNSSTHKTPAIRDWLTAHPRFVLHFTPSSSWLNLVERWFAELTNKKLRRATHRSVRELNTDIRAWIQPGTATPPLRLDQNRRPVLKHQQILPSWINALGRAGDASRCATVRPIFDSGWAERPAATR